MAHGNGMGIDTDLSFELPPDRPKPPETPPMRTFTVRRPGTGPEQVSNEVLAMAVDTVEAHQVEISTHGDLLFFEYSFNSTPDGYVPVSMLRRAFAAGQWLDLREVMMLSKLGVFYH